jgi:hypothetical protein
MAFHGALVIKTTVLLTILALFWARPLVHFIRVKPYAQAAQSAAKISLFWLELVYVPVSTTIIQYLCAKIAGEGSRLRVQLSLSCDDTARRRSFVLFSAFMVLYLNGE